MNCYINSLGKSTLVHLFLFLDLFIFVRFSLPHSIKYSFVSGRVLYVVLIGLVLSDNKWPLARPVWLLNIYSSTGSWNVWLGQLFYATSTFDICSFTASNVHGDIKGSFPAGWLLIAVCLSVVRDCLQSRAGRGTPSSCKKYILQSCLLLFLLSYSSCQVQLWCGPRLVKCCRAGWGSSQSKPSMAPISLRSSWVISVTGTGHGSHGRRTISGLFIVH